MTGTPLPELERQLIDAAARLEAAATPQRRRRRWPHGWALLSIAVVTAGAGVAVARVTHTGPFSYLDRMTHGGNTRFAAASEITVQDQPQEPTWQARAFVNGVGQLCLTGGPRDPRTNPPTTPRTEAENPPQVGLLCADNEGVAEALVDPERPGASVANAAPLDGSLNGNRLIQDPKNPRRLIPDPSQRPATRFLAMAVREAGAPAPVVRWASGGASFPMRRSDGELLLPVDHSPLGLDRRERSKLASYPRELRLALWAAEVPVPKGATFPQVISGAEFGPPRVNDTTIELAGAEDIDRIIRHARAVGWKYQRGISRDPLPVRGTRPAQRRWIAAFGRERAARDRLPAALRRDRDGYQRIGFAASRRLSVTGGGLSRAWVAPGGLPKDSLADDIDLKDRICLLGNPVFGEQCRTGAGKWKVPFAEQVLCRASLGPGGALLFALTPTGARSVQLLERDGTTRRLPLAELVALRRPRSAMPRAIRWAFDGGRALTVRTPQPTRSMGDCDAADGGRGWSTLRVDSTGAVSSTGKRIDARRPG